MKLHKRFILDVWKSAAYYDFQQSFKVPDTFYLHEKRIDWIFTGKSGKIFKKKADNSTVSLVKDYFCGLQKNQQENEMNDQVVASQFQTSQDEGICYFHYLDLSGVCELLVDSFKKKDDYSDQDNTNYTEANNQDYEETNNLYKIQNPQELLDKTTMIQTYQADSNEKNMIKVEWNLNGKFSAQKRINNYESFRKEDDYKSYIIFEDEDLSVNREQNMKDKQSLLSICQHISNSMHLIHSERGQITQLTLLLKQINNVFYLLACPAMSFQNDSSLPSLWRMSFNFKLKYPNETNHMKNALKDAESCVKKLESKTKIQQCNCCKNFSTKLQTISSSKLIQIRMRRGIGISQYEAKQLKKKDFSEVCEVCYQIFMEIHKISNYNSQANSITENSFTSKPPSVSILHSYRSNSTRQKRIQSNYESGTNQMERQNSEVSNKEYNTNNSFSNYNYNISTYKTSSNKDNINSHKKDNLNSIQRGKKVQSLERDNQQSFQRDNQSSNLRDNTNSLTRDYQSQRSSSKLPPSFRISEKTKNNIFGSNQFSSKNLKKEHEIQSSQNNLNYDQQDISQQQYSVNIQNFQNPLLMRNQISYPLVFPQNIQQTANKHKYEERRQSNSSQLSSSKLKEYDYISIPIDIKKDQTILDLKESPINSDMHSIIMKIPQNERESAGQERQVKTIKGKFGIKMALKNIKKDVRKQQDEIKSVIEEELNNNQEKIKHESQQVVNTRYSKPNERQTLNNSEELAEYSISQHKQGSISQINPIQEVYNQPKALPPRSKNSSRSNRTAISNQSTTNQSFSSNPLINSSIESSSQQIIPIYAKKNSNNFEPDRYLRDLANQTENGDIQIQLKSNQILYAQDTLFSQRIRKNSFEQDARTQPYQAQNEIIDYGEPQKTIHNESLEVLDFNRLEQATTISQQFLQNKNTFLDNQTDSDPNQQQLSVFRVRRSQSFKK